MFPLDESFLAAINPSDVHGGINLREKEMVLTTLRFYFGPAQGWGAVHDVSDPGSLNQLNHTLRQPGERYDLLESQTPLAAGHFSQGHASTGMVTLYVAKKDNPGLSPSYFVYELETNLTLYIGPDLLHNMPGHLVLNCLVLAPDHRPTQSLTLRT
ncbi:hypothetical protein AB1L30_14025 [Bremerella sp. JC817]|uniref:hypothetical protein n=1 Tax=Bremerella sp. JC817 TaxID=3231756 RepID=UPI003459221F